MSFVELLPVLIPATVTAVGTTSSMIYTMRKRNEELKAKKVAEARSFYLQTAQTLVLSAERMNLTGMQKKEYVMTRLENECIRAEVKVDYMQMSMAIERAALVMNDHRELGRPVSELMAEADARVAAELQTQTDANLEVTKEALVTAETLAKTSLEAAKSIFSRKEKK